MFVNAGKIDRIKENGCLKTTILGRNVMVCYFDGEFVAIDIGSAWRMPGSHSIPSDLFGTASVLLGSPRGSLDADRGDLIFYPVATDDENIFIGSNPV